MGLQPWHIIVVVVVALLLFGGKKLPEAARGLGRSLRIFKSEVSAMSDDGKAKTDAPAATPAAQVAAAPVVPVAPAVVTAPVVAARAPVVTTPVDTTAA